MQPLTLLGLLCAAIAALLAEPGLPIAAAAEPVPPAAFDLDPLRQFLPRDDIYMQVPGGVLAVEDNAAPGDPIELQAQGRHGGLVVGYCLRSSCSRVTHLAVLQVCSNRLGGPSDDERLILGVIRLPHGATPGYLKSLQGRDYTAHPPVTRGLVDQTTGEVPSIYSLTAIGKGPVASFEWARPVGSDETLTVNMSAVRNLASGRLVPQFEVRHLCQQHTS
jgi:hypothetical protein